MKNIVILSGGSGNDALLKGIYQLYSNANIKVIINAYDDGKSTGLCRKLTNTLGVSDVRKNHFRMYMLVHPNDANSGIVSFYKERLDIPNDNKFEFVSQKLYAWGLNNFVPYAKRFFENDSTKNIEFKDFSIANIVYSQMYSEIGYKKTNHLICELIGIEDFVILNSFENVVIGAKTQNGTINDEAGIVDFSNKLDRIEHITYNCDSPIIINNDVIAAINDADIIIISTGTFWSSILPTLEYGKLYKSINKSCASKFWIMNNEEDKDALGVGSNDFIKIIDDLGLDLSDVTIIENNDAAETLRQSNENKNIVYYSMGNNSGKHDPLKLAIAVFSEYYSLDKNGYDTILIDFDNTIYSKNESCKKANTSNIIEVSKNSKIQIVSGNDYKTSILPYINAVFDGKDYIFRNNVWADAASVLYVCGKAKSFVEKHLLDVQQLKKLASYLEENFKIHGVVNDNDLPTCYKIKPLSSLERKLLRSLLNDFILPHLHIYGMKAILAGRTTIDIVALYNDKENVFDKESMGKVLYIGDELMDFGNDCAIAKCCNNSIQVENVWETNLILKLLNAK